ncbi:PDGLE domain-containing protein [Thermincola potens]|uniref:PDGLE domain-containing protein n=1 Tax=Thermincola potens (strain JR) TaxID=635013 RepID=D5XEL9_THEPJ|nr:PDGLE domain-containing protein [Thermincola potens]ADG82090.1 conserved hypothetical protein [Thermincola potens JR]
MSKKIIIALLFALAVAAFLSPFASSHPDGLERVAEDKGFLHKAEGKEVIQSPMPDYTVPWIRNEKISGSAAGVIGTILTFGLMYGVAKLATTRKLKNSKIE